MSRDIRSLMGALFNPLLMIFLFGYALSLDVDRIPTVVLDLDRTPVSREFIHRLTDSSANSVFLFTRNNDVFGPADTRSQDPLFVSENHLTYAFNPKWWGSVDLRWQAGGETSTDGVPDDNLTNILGGGATLGHQFTRHLGGYGSYGRVLAKKGDAQEWMVRFQLAYSF